MGKCLFLKELVLQFTLVIIVMDNMWINIKYNMIILKSCQTNAINFKGWYCVDVFVNHRYMTVIINRGMESFSYLSVWFVCFPFFLFSLKLEKHTSTLGRQQDTHRAPLTQAACSGRQWMHDPCFSCLCSRAVCACVCVFVLLHLF